MYTPSPGMDQARIKKIHQKKAKGLPDQIGLVGFSAKQNRLNGDPPSSLAKDERLQERSTWI
jgi:hypothetical protein